MTKDEYLESQRGKTYTQIIAEQPMLDVVGSIRGENLRDVVAILAGGLQYRLDNAVLPPEAEPLRTALQVAFKYLDLPDYAINLSLPENELLLLQAVTTGLVTQAEADKFLTLATYQKPEFNLTREDCAEYFNGNAWNEIEATDKQWLQVQLNTTAPEPTHIVVQWQASNGEWYHATAIHGLLAPVQYRAQLPFYGVARKLRLRCEYLLDAVVTVV